MSKNQTDNEYGFGMRVDMRVHPEIREQVRDGLQALRIQARQIWGDDKLVLMDVVPRLMVGVGDLARLYRDGWTGGINSLDHERFRQEVRKECGNVIFSMIRWIDDMGLDVLECLDLAIAAQERFAKSGRPR